MGQPREPGVEARVRPVADPADQALQRGGAGQQNTALQEPAGRKVEQDAGALRGDPRPAVEVAPRAEQLRLRAEGLLAALLPDLRDVLAMGRFSFGVAWQHG
jgi:hypothetical protein